MVLYLLLHLLCLVAPSLSQSYEHLSKHTSLNDYVGFKDRPNTPETHFKFLGTTAVNTEFAHLTFRYDLDHIFNTVNNIIISLADTRNSAPHTVPHEEFIVLHTHYALQRDRISRMFDYAAPSMIPRRRTKRFACAGVCIAIAAGAAAAATLTSTAGLGLAIYNKVEADNMAARISNVAAAMAEEFVRLDETVHGALDLDTIAEAATKIAAKNIRHRSRVFWFQMSLTRVTAIIDGIENALRSGRSNRLDPSIINHSNITGVFKHLRRYAQKNNLKLISDDAHDLLHLPATLTGTTNGFNILTHFPLVRPDSILDIYQHIRLPIPVGAGMFLSLESEHDTIAISPDQQTFRLTSTTELSTDCSLLGTFYACPRGNSARHPPSTPPQSPSLDPALCLWGLFTGHTVTVNMACEKTLTRPTAEAVQLSARTFVTFGEAHGTITCRDHRGITMPFITKAYGSFVLPAGCRATSPNFTLASSDARFTRTEGAWTRATPIPTNVTQFMDGIRQDEMDTLLHALQNTRHNLTKISLDEARRHLQVSRQLSEFHPFQWSWPHLFPSLSLSSITFMLTVGHILYTLLARLRKTHPKTDKQVVINNHCEVTPTAPPKYPAQFPEIPL